MTTQTATNSQLPMTAANFLNGLLGGTSSGGSGTTGTSSPAMTTSQWRQSRPTRTSMAGMSADERRTALDQYHTSLDQWRASRPSRATTPAGTGGSASTSQNAYIDELANSIGNKVVPGVMSNFALSGRSGASPLAMSAVGSGIASELAPYMFGSAENAMNRAFQGDQNQLNRQMQGLALSPGIAAAQYGPANAMLGVGGMIDSKTQQYLDNPAQMLANYMNIVGQPFGSQTSQTGTMPIDHQSGFAPLRIFGK